MSALDGSVTIKACVRAGIENVVMEHSKRTVACQVLNASLISTYEYR
jgi:hypothetical protein